MKSHFPQSLHTYPHRYVAQHPVLPESRALRHRINPPTAASTVAWWVLRFGFAALAICIHHVRQWLEVSTIAVTSTALLVFWLAWACFLRPKWFSPLRHLPGPDGGHWLLGQLLNIVNADPGVTMLQWMQQIPNQGIIRYLGILNQERLLVTSPRALSDVLVTHQDDFQKPAPTKWSISRVLGNGVFLAEGSEHRHQRKILEPAFSYRHIKNLYPVFWAKAAESAAAMAREMESAGTDVLEVDGWAFRLSLDIIGTAGLGRDFSSVQEPDCALARAYHDVYKPSRQALILDLLYLVLPGPVVNLIPATRNIEYARAAKTIKGICRDIIREKRARMAQEEPEPDHPRLERDRDITSVLLRDNTGLDDEAVLAQMTTFLAAGHEAPAAAFTWAVYLLCLHRDVQSRLRAEVRAHLPSPLEGDPRHAIAAADVDRLPYLAAVCSEVLRFLPPSPLTIREAVRDTAVAGQFVPKGTYVMLSLWAINRSEGLWGRDAGRFDPDRWLTAVTSTTSTDAAGAGGAGEAAARVVRASGSGGARSNYAFMTFLQGRKNCIGQNFAVAELACVVANWVGRFEFELRDPADAAGLEINRGGVTMRPVKGLYVSARVVEGW